MDYKGLVEKYSDQLIEDLFGLLKIESVKNTNDGTPVGQGPKDALLYMLNLGKRDGFITKNVKDIAGHIQHGDGDKLFGVLGHVDVVPSGNGWTHDAFSPQIINGEIYARGVQDDKGPTMAAYYAMKILKEEGYDFKQRLRLIIGTDEESDWACTSTYFDNEEMPDLGFAPDAEFPLIHGEKGISMIEIKRQFNEDSEGNYIQSFNSGDRLNMVPERAELTVNVDEVEVFTHELELFLQENGLNGEFNVFNNTVDVTLFGKSAHGSTPEVGINAALNLFKFLNETSVKFNEESQSIIQFVNQYFVDDYKAVNIGMDYYHEELGETSVNVGKITINSDTVHIGVNLRFPDGLDFENNLNTFNTRIQNTGFHVANFSVQAPHYVEKDDPLVQVLVDSYRNHVNDSREPFTIGGGTYARTLTKGVAFGAMFENTVDTMHQKDERMKVEELLLATQIYLEAIHRIIVKEELK